jgi:hypothetical protein
MISLITYLIGIPVARLQLRSWLKEEILTEEDEQLVMILSALSWGIYPAYLVNSIINRLNIK